MNSSFAKCNWGLIVVRVIWKRSHLVLMKWLLLNDIPMGLRRAYALGWEGHHLLLVLDNRLLVQISLVGRLLRDAWIIRLTCSNEVRLLELLHAASAGSTLSLMVGQVDWIVAPEILPGFSSLDDFVHAAELMISEGPHANSTALRAQSQVSAIS